MLDQNGSNAGAVSIVTGIRGTVNNYPQHNINTFNLECAKDEFFAVGDLVDVVLSGDPAEALRGHIGYCGRCGCEDVMVKVGKPPHAYSLNCADCGKYIKWLNKSAIVLIGGAA